MADKTFITIKPPLKAINNGDGTYSVSIKDVNSAAILAGIIGLRADSNLNLDDILAAIEALRVVSTLDSVEAAIEALRTTSTLDTVEAAIEALLVGPLSVGIANTAAIDAFGRFRVSNPKTIFDSKQIFDNAPLLWDDAEESGGSTTSIHSVAQASTTLAVGTAAGVRTRQTFRRFNYQPGKSQQIFMTGILDASGGGTGITRAIGFFDDDNGLFFEDDEGTIKVVRRTKVTGSVVNNKVAQSSWNHDVMDGTGPSGITVDWTKAQIFVIDFEWLGVGRIRFGLVIDGEIRHVHEFHVANTLTTVSMSTPNLPLRYRIENDGAGVASSLVHLCSTVISEGGQDEIGVLRYKSTEGTHVDANVAGTIYAIVGIRLKSTHLGATVKLSSFSILAETNDDFEWIIILNPTVAGTFTYGDETSSGIQAATGATTNTVTGGTKINGGFASATKDGGTAGEKLENALLLGAKIDGTPDELVLCVRPLSANANIQGSMTWRELV